MYYISSRSYNKKGIKQWGITDTDDGTEEFYTEYEIHNILEIIGYTSIKGAVYTGSRVKCTVVTPKILLIDELPKGAVFEIEVNKLVTRYSKICELGKGKGWWVGYDGYRTELTYEYLIENDKEISIKVLGVD